MHNLKTTADDSGRALQLLERLKELLEREIELMRDRRTQELLEIASRKAEIVDDLNRLSQQLAPLLATKSDPIGSRLREELEECHSLNTRNGIFARTAAQGARSAMVLLRTTLSFDDVTLYDAKGDIAERREARSFGHV